MWIGGFPKLRWQQTFNVGYVPNSVVPKVFMAVALDLRDDPNKSVNSPLRLFETVDLSLVSIQKQNKI